MQSVMVMGAAAGIGLTIATRFARAGWLVGLFDLDEKESRELAYSDAGLLVAQIPEHIDAMIAVTTDIALEKHPKPRPSTPA